MARCGGSIWNIAKPAEPLNLRNRRSSCEKNGSDSNSPFGVIFAEAGVASPKLARFAATHDLVGAEFLAGIPGTVGGALAMNAGCYGHETWEFVTQVLTVNRCGEVNRRSPKEYRVSYRHVEPDAELGEKLAATCNEWFVGAWFMFPRGDGNQSRLERSSNCWKNASPASRSICPTPVRCSAIRRATLPPA
jgi:hypothetical protein